MIYTISELAKYWKVSQSTIRRLIKRGELRTVMIGCSHRIKEEWITEYENGSKKLKLC